MLAAGTTLGHYKIVAPLGAGGMGEVYRAHDSRLGRDVAIKVLPQHLAATPEVRARFEREARTISQLNHPHICTLHDVGHQDGTDYLVMELLEGETLAHRLEKGALPVAEVLSLGRQIAEALDRAHRAGVVHRDLKPGNVMLTKAGAKLMDFGLARAPGMAAAASAMSQSPTVSRPLTAEGTIVGTFQYMAPEQLEGKEADARSDLWALGCVLYEMATGQRAFAGESQASLIAAIMTGEPRAMTELRPVTPPALDRVVRACLAKDPEQRIQTAYDLGLQLQWISEVGSQTGPAPLPGVRRKRWSSLALTLTFAVVAALAAGWALRGAFVPGTGTVRRFSVLAPPDVIVSALPRFSADGKALLAQGTQRGAPVGSGRAIWRRDLDRFEWRKIDGTDGALDYEISQDGRWLFVLQPLAEGSRLMEIRRIPVDGSSPGTLVSTWSEEYANWQVLRDGRLLVVERGWKRFALLSPGASAPLQWRELHSDHAILEARLFSALPDGRTVLACVGYYGERGWTSSCGALDFEDGDLTILQENAFSPHLLSGDWLLMSRKGTVLAARWDARARRLASQPVAVLGGLLAGGEGTRASALTVSPSGDLGCVPGVGASNQRSLAVLRPDGRIGPWNDVRSNFDRPPACSPDGRIAIATEVRPGTATWQVLVLRRGQPGARRFASVEGEDCFDGHIAPNGRDVVWFRSGSDSTAGLWLAPIDDSAPPRRIQATSTATVGQFPSWYPDGRSVLVASRTEQGRRVLLRVTPGVDTAAVTEVVREAYDVGPGAISPDGSRIAYVSWESREGILVVATLRPDGRAGDPVPVSSAAWANPQWADNTTLLWGTPDLTVMAATVSPSLVVSEPTKRFDLSPWVTEVSYFELLPDGSLLIIRKAEGEGEGQLDIVLNYRVELERAMRRALGAVR